MNRKTCDQTGKRCYGSRNEAHRAVQTMHARVRVYRCDHCHALHVANAGKG